MAEIHISEMRSQVEVTDTEALLSPGVLSRIVAAVQEELDRKAREDEARIRQTHIGGQGLR